MCHWVDFKPDVPVIYLQGGIWRLEPHQQLSSHCKGATSKLLPGIRVEIVRFGGLGQHLWFLKVYVFLLHLVIKSSKHLNVLQQSVKPLAMRVNPSKTEQVQTDWADWCGVQYCSHWIWLLYWLKLSNNISLPPNRHEIFWYNKMMLLSKTNKKLLDGHASCCFVQTWSKDSLATFGHRIMYRLLGRWTGIIQLSQPWIILRNSHTKNTPIIWWKRATFSLHNKWGLI